MYLKLFLMAGLTLFLAGGALAQDKNQDAKKVHGLYTAVMAIGDPRMPENGTGLDIGDNAPKYAKALKDTLALQRLWEENGPFLKQFKETYAPGEPDYTVSRVINENFEGMALGFQVGNEYRDAMERLNWLNEDLAQNNSLSCLAQIRREGTDEGYLKTLHEIYRVKAISEARQLLDLCPRFAPDNQTVLSRVEELRPQVEATLAKFKAEEMKELAGRKWPGGTPTAAGQAFLQNHPDWGGKAGSDTKILKVAVSGNWFVAERNLFGQPTHYGLPVVAAVQNNRMDPGVITLYDLSLITTGPQQAQNFERAWVGKVWRMLSKNLPQ